MKIINSCSPGWLKNLSPIQAGSIRQCEVGNKIFSLLSHNKSQEHFSRWLITGAASVTDSDDSVGVILTSFYGRYLAVILISIPL